VSSVGSFFSYVNGKFYCEILKWLREGIRCNHPDKWKKNNWFLHHDNVPAHTSLAVQQLLTSKNITVIPHPPFTWPCPLRLFPILQDEITAERASFWHNWGDPCRNARGYRHTFENFQGCMKSWETCCDHCIHAYFKGDSGN